LGCGLACLAALLVRFRRARGIQRQQLKWLLFACAVTIAIVVVVQPSTSSQWDLGMLLALPLYPAVPVAAGVAILRYRLYELDRIINRTLVYGLLTAVLALGYAAGSLLFALVAGAGKDPPSWLVAAATLAAAAVFRPVRGPHPGPGGPALQPAPLPRGQDDRRVQRSPARRGRPGHALGRAGGRGGRDDGADPYLMLASTFPPQLLGHSPW
jgi:hypothetical protein